MKDLKVLPWPKSEMSSLVLQCLFEYLLKNIQNSFGILEPKRDSAARLGSTARLDHLFEGDKRQMVYCRVPLDSWSVGLIITARSFV